MTVELMHDKGDNYFARQNYLQSSYLISCLFWLLSLFDFAVLFRYTSLLHPQNCLLTLNQQLYYWANSPKNSDDDELP